MIGVIPEAQSLTRPLTCHSPPRPILMKPCAIKSKGSVLLRPTTRFTTSSSSAARRPTNFSLKLTIVSKASVAELKERSAKFGFRIDHFAIEAPDGGALETLAFAVGRLRAKMSLEAKALLAAAFILAASLVFVPIVGKWEQAKALEKEVSTLKPKAEQVLKLQSERDKIVARRAQMIGLKKAAFAADCHPLQTLGASRRSNLSVRYADGSRGYYDQRFVHRRLEACAAAWHD